MMNKKDKIMIIGAKGNLGGQLMRVLGNEYRLVLFDKDTLDITRRGKINEAVLFHKPHFIINAAAYNAVDKCEEEREFMKAKELNQFSVAFLAEAALRHQAVLIHFSSDYVFGAYDAETLEKIKNQEGFSETDKPMPANNYAKTKYWGEEEILKKAEAGLRYYLIRTSKLFGPKGESGEAKPSFFDMMLELSKKNKNIKVVDGERSCFTYTFDLAGAVKDLIEGNREYGIYHIVNQDSATWYEGAKFLFDACKIDSGLEKVGAENFRRPAKRPEYSVLKNTKLKPLRSYRDALKDYLDI